MKFFTKILAAMLLPLLLASCDKTPKPPMVFGANVWPGFEPVYLARELGYFSETNLRLDEYGSAAEVIQAFRNGKVQVAAVTLEDALLLNRDIPTLKIVLLFDAEKTADEVKPQSGAGSRAPGKILNVLVIRDEYIGQYHRELLGMVQGWRRALDYLKAEPGKAMQMMAKREKIDADKFAKSLQGLDLLGLQRNRELMLGDPPAVSASLDQAQRLLLNRGALQMGAEASALIDTTLLAEVKQ